MNRRTLHLQIALLLAACGFMGLFWFGQSLEPVEQVASIQVSNGVAMEEIVEPRFRWERLAYLGLAVIGIIELFIAVRLWRFSSAWRREYSGL